MGEEVVRNRFRGRWGLGFVGSLELARALAAGVKLIEVNAHSCYEGARGDSQVA